MIVKRLGSALFLVLLALSVAGCASYAGRGLTPGVATLPEVLATMGAPAMQWREADGRQQLAYPRGPEGVHTFMVHLDTAGKLVRIENVLDERHFARIVPGVSTPEDVLRLLGPSTPQWTAYFMARDERVWEWLFCDSGGYQARFDVLFDGTTNIVRTTFSRPDYRGPDGGVPVCVPMAETD